MAYYEFINNWGSHYRDIDGNPVERTPLTHKYSYDEFVLYKASNFDKKDCWVYSDRMLQWDREKYSEAFHKVWPGKTGCQSFWDRTPEEINRFLSLYFDKNVTLTAIMQGCNASTGYPYWVFAYKEVKEQEV